MLRAILLKFQSRKLWSALAAFGYAVANGEVEVAAGVAVAYLITEGVIDAKAVNSVTFK